VKATRDLVKFLKPYWLSAVLAPLLMLLEVAMDLMQPRMIQRIVDEGITQMNMPVVIETGLWMILFAFIGMIGGVGCTIYATVAAQGFGADLRSSLFRKVQSLSFSNLDELETGQLVTRLTNDVTQVQEMVAMLLRIMVRAPLMLIGSLAMVIITSLRLSMMLLVLGPLVAVLIVWVIRKAYPMFSSMQQKLDDLNSVLQENLAGVRVVKAFARHEHEIGRFGKANDALMTLTVRAARALAVTWPGMMTIMNLGIVAAVWFGGVQVTAGDLQTGQLIAFVNYLGRTLMSLMMVSMLVMRLARAQASAERIQEVFDSKPAIQNEPDARTDFNLRGQVAFEGVSFSYGNGESPVLKDISFTAEPGQTVAVLGATGSGKSSLVHLIPRFYDVSNGRVTLDGMDVRYLDEKVLRRSISIALQESILFSGTIKDNIRYSRPEATDEEVIEAAQAAQAHDFIVQFPGGYESQIGQRGVNLSGGQKQRIAIARALLAQPLVLILDDSTSSVDVETESLIEEALEKNKRQRTRFVVAQRISTVLNADKILVLDEGRIAAQGTHQELLKTSRIYGEIYESQLGNGVVAHG
jgi:ATP-binding cassette, subfamily B, multidrug efflux pump